MVKRTKMKKTRSRNKKTIRHRGGRRGTKKSDFKRMNRLYNYLFGVPGGIKKRIDEYLKIRRKKKQDMEDESEVRDRIDRSRRQVAEIEAGKKIKMLEKLYSERLEKRKEQANKEEDNINQEYLNKIDIHDFNSNLTKFNEYLKKSIEDLEKSEEELKLKLDELIEDILNERIYIQNEAEKEQERHGDFDSYGGSSNHKKMKRKKYKTLKKVNKSKRVNRKSKSR